VQPFNYHRLFSTSDVRLVKLCLRRAHESLFMIPLLALAASGAATQAQSQPAPAPSTVVIAGVVSGADGSPLPGVEVAVTGSKETRPQLALTDERGRYRLAGLPPALYTVRAWKLGYALLTFGQREPSDSARMVDLRVATSAVDINFVLPKAAVIVVKVLDASGEPLAGATVQASTMRYVDGQRKLVSVPAGHFVYPTTTDDRGEARLFGLASGEYYLSARAQEHGPFNTGATGAQFFHPGTMSAESAQPVTVGPGDDRFVVIVTRPSARGTLTAKIAGQNALTQVSSQILAIHPGGTAGFPLRTQSEGGFTAVDLPPGNYVVQVRARNALGADEFAHVPLTFSGEDSTISIITSPPGIVTGRVVLDSNLPSARALKPAEIQLLPAFVGFAIASGSVDLRDDWTFRIQGIAGVGFLQVRSAGDRWFLKKVIVNSQDLTDRPVDFQTAFRDQSVEVYLTQSRSEVTGLALDSRGTPTGDFVVVAFSEDPSRWTPRSRYVATARPDQIGQYRITGLPAGPYLIAALDRFERGREYDVETLAGC
jgi:hypothetical protein